MSLSPNHDADLQFAARQEGFREGLEAGAAAGQQHMWTMMFLGALWAEQFYARLAERACYELDEAACWAQADQAVMFADFAYKQLKTAGFPLEWERE